VEQAVGIVRQVVSALVAAHEVGIVHRDLKPGNVMLVAGERRPLVKVLDFGLARFSESATYQKLTMTGVVVGTPSYMAPEQAFGDPVDHRADLWAVGAILHALLTGAPPFGSGKSPDLLPRLLANERERLTETRRDLGPIVEVVERLLEPEPEQRYATAAELDAALAPFDAKVPTTREWKRPPTIATLALAPDPVLDAPRPRKRPRTVLKPPPATATEASEPETSSPRRILLLAGAALSAMVLSAGVVWLAVSEGPEHGQSGEATTDVLAVAPVASPDVGVAAAEPEPNAADTGVAALLDAAMATQAPRAAHAASAAPATDDDEDEVAAPEHYHYHFRIEILESYLQPQRFHRNLRYAVSYFDRCLAGIDSVPTPPPYTWHVVFHYGPNAHVAYEDDAREPFHACVRGWMQSVWATETPDHDADLRLRIVVEAAAEGGGGVSFVDRTDWSSRELTPPRLRLTVTIEESDVPMSLVRSRLRQQTAAFNACLGRRGDLPSPPPYEGSASWSRVGEYATYHSDFTGDPPRAVRICIDSRVVRGTLFPLEGNDEVRARFRAEAAGETSIVVRGAD
jgi:hypothetical protein